MGIYIHIPFCRQACRYCDFFFSVSLRYTDEFVDRLVQEIESKGRSHTGDSMNTLYLGGGTPSLLSHKNLNKILKSVHRHFTFRQDAEVTIECNPDDLDPIYLRELKRLGFNRLSIGVQSFIERDLELMRRSHDSKQANRSVRDAAAAGFNNLTIDLIYGIPGQTQEEWEENLIQAISLPVTHLSAYHLTFEPGTVFDHWRKKGKVIPVHEKESVALFQSLRGQMLSAGFEHYEISNFARDGKRSEHNLLYWSGAPYMGIGPSAHSFDGIRRIWNPSSLKDYMEVVSKGEGFSESEHLTLEDQYHDYLITSLRTRWGADPHHIREAFGQKIGEHFNDRSAPFLEGGSLWLQGDHVAIHPDRWLISDHILKELFLD